MAQTIDSFLVSLFWQ